MPLLASQGHAFARKDFVAFAFKSSGGTGCGTRQQVTERTFDRHDVSQSASNAQFCGSEFLAVLVERNRRGCCHCETTLGAVVEQNFVLDIGQVAADADAVASRLW